MDNSSEKTEQLPLTARERELLRIWRESFPLSQGDPDLQEDILHFVIKSGGVKPNEFEDVA